jgi:peptidoglycan/xylan/chitin deacetylase (PgdA/CDA1 family)
MKPFKTAAAVALRGAETFGLFDLLERGERDRRDVLRVLMYHRIGDSRDHSLYPGLVSASPRAFERQIRCLAERHRFVSMDEVLHWHRTGSRLPPRALLLTFDDAYADFAEHAWPILSELGLPATVFVPTAIPDRPRLAFWWDRLFRAIEGSDRAACESTPLGRLELRDSASRRRAFRRLRDLIESLPHDRAMQLVDDISRELGESPAPNPVLGWDALRSLARAGVTLCSHTRTHPKLDRIPTALIRREVAGSLADLQREIGNVLPVFAYPEGRFGKDAVHVVAKEGVELAFTTDRGLNHMASAHPLLLRRIPVWPRATDPVLRAQLMGWTVGLNRFAQDSTLRRPVVAGS